MADVQHTDRKMEFLFLSHYSCSQKPRTAAIDIKLTLVRLTLSLNSRGQPAKASLVYPLAKCCG